MLQEYFVALYLLRKPLKDFKEFAMQHYSLDTWQEPMLLALSYKSRQSSRNNRQEAKELISAIVDTVATETTYNDHFHLNLLFTASWVADSGAWSIDRTIQYQIANHMLIIMGVLSDWDMYNDSKRLIKLRCTG